MVVLNVILLFSVFCNVSGFNPFTEIYCRYNECCTERWIDFNVTALREGLQQKLHGQHLVSRIIFEDLTTHMTTRPRKALVLFFHGGVGTGKSFVSKIIAESIYKKGMRSTYVHYFSAMKEFPHLGMRQIYKRQIKERIESGVKKCTRSLFIFDETDKLPAGLGLMNILRPYIYDTMYKNRDGTNYRNAIFILISNTGSKDISKYALETRRENIELKDLSNIIKHAHLNILGLYHDSFDISNNLLPSIVPFLPLEKKHVEMCIKDVLALRYPYIKRKIGEITAEVVLKELVFVPEDKELFSLTGCKRVSDKVDYALEDDS